MTTESFWVSILKMFLFGMGVVLVGWVFWRAFQQSDDPGRLAKKWVVTLIFFPAGIWAVKVAGPFGVPVLALCAVIVGITWAPNLGALLASPLTNMFDGGDADGEPVPFYSIAEAKRKQGRYQEAIAEVRKQLALFPEDFRGWTLLAEIQAENLNDLTAAQESLERVLSQRDHPEKNRVYCLNRLADWQLKRASDPAAAKETLERIVTEFPDTEFAQLALQRISHLAGGDWGVQSQDRRVVPLPHVEGKLGLHEDPSSLKPAAEDPAQTAAAYIRHLESYPFDNETREKLAILYADFYGRLDLAQEQLEQLVEAPHQPAKAVVHWLNLLADLQIRTAGDVVGARASLQRIVDRFPKIAAAENATHRMAHLNLELRAKKESQAVKLGSYEQNIGLKGRSPPA